MDCLVRRDDNTIAYVNKMHKYKSDGNTPRPKINNKNNELQKLKQKQKEQQQQKLKQEKDLKLILQMFL